MQVWEALDDDSQPAVEADLAALVTRDPPPADSGRPHVAVNMAASLDGAVEIGGRSSPLSGEADRALFHALRSLADVIVVGAGTARAEAYRRPSAATGLTGERRRQRGQAEVPRLCVVSRSLAFEADTPPALRDEAPPGEGAVWLATTRSASEVHRVAPHAEAIELSGDAVSAAALVEALAERGMRRMLMEGGPTLLGRFLDDDVIDEWNVTITPLAVGGEARRMVVGGRGVPRGFVIDRVIHADSVLFVRYRRDR